MRRQLTFGLLLFTAACASAPPGESGESGESGDEAAQQEILEVRVNNNLIPPTVVTIYLFPERGIERSLGNAFSARTTIFEYRGLQPKGRYVLVARATDGRAMASNSLIMDGVLGLEWTLQSNFVAVTRTTRDE